MTACARCGKPIPDDAPKCPECGAIVAERERSVLAHIAESEIKLKTLLLDVPKYARQFSQIVKAPLVWFRSLDYTDPDALKRAVAFMLQGITLSFLIATAGWVLPQSIAVLHTRQTLLLTGSQQDVAEYVARVQAVKAALPEGLADEWRQQGELMLATRVLPEDRFQAMLDRLRELAEENPDLLADAVKGKLTSDKRFGGRGYVLSFFLALDPRLGPLLQQTRDASVIGRTYELKPHVDFLVRTLVLWYLTCAVMTWRLAPPARDPRKHAAFVMGAWLVGFLGPLVETFRALLHIYLALVLPKFIDKSSALLTSATDLGAWTSGVFPFENVLLTVVGIGVPLAAVGVALAALVAGIRSAYSVPKERAQTAAVLGLAAGLGGAELASHLATLLIAPTGLV